MQDSLLTQFVFPITTALIMLGLGLSLSLVDFARLFQKPKALILGMVNQLLALPLLGFSLAYAYELSPEFALGLIIIAICPGGTFSNILVHLSRGDTALSITLTALSSLITFLTIPLWLAYAFVWFGGSSTEIRLSVWELMLQIALMTTVPVLLGVFIRRHYPIWSARVLHIFDRFLGVFVGLIIVLALLKEQGRFVELMLATGLPTLSLNALALLMGFSTAWLFGLSSAQTKAMTVEVGIQNVPLAFTIALGIIQNQLVSIPAATYGAVMMLSAALFLFASKWSVFSRFE